MGHHRRTLLAIDRRQFLNRSLCLSAAVALSAQSPFAAGAAENGGGKLTAAVIGHTGRGDYGHGLDAIFNNRPDVEVVAVADPDASGRAKAAQSTKAARQYADYREMLEKERPRLVSLASRWTDQRHAMAMAAVGVGAHLFTEKPFTTRLIEADEILAAAGRAGLKTAVAHPMRMAPNLVALKREIDSGLLGDLLQLNAWGKQDARAGGEDMLILGTHLFDLMRMFAGDPEWCTARVLQDGRDITAKDARPVGEAVGPVAGNEIYAQFAFPKGVNASFNSRGRWRGQTGVWGVELIGSKTSARVAANPNPSVYLLNAPDWDESGRKAEWRKWEPSAAPTVSSDPNGRLVDDWLDAIRANREPAASGRNAMKAVEMVMAVYQAALSQARVPMPLTDRRHPLMPA